MDFLAKKYVVLTLVFGTVAVGAVFIALLFYFMGGGDPPAEPYGMSSVEPRRMLFPGRAKIHLYFAAEDGKHLKSEERLISSAFDSSQLGETIVSMLIDGSKEGLIRTVPKETSLRAFYVSGDQIAYVDLNSAARENHPGGIQTEILTVFSIVNSLILNIPEVKRVKLLIEGQEADTFAGHVDLRYPLQADMLLIQ